MGGVAAGYGSDPAVRGILNADEVHRIWRDFVDNGNWRIQIWYLLMFQSWMQMNEKDMEG